jgi:sulfur relay (sulfurtransferase) DsrF/TusC family protein
VRHLIVLQKEPGASENAAELLELGMAMASFDQNVEVWLRGAAQLWLSPQLREDRLPRFNAARLLHALPFYDVGPIWITSRDTEDVIHSQLAVEVVEANELADRLGLYDAIHWE